MCLSSPKGNSNLRVSSSFSSFSSLCLQIFFDYPLPLAMTKASKSGVVGGVDKGKTTEEKGKESHFRTRIGMDLDQKTFRLRNQVWINI